MYNVQFGDAFLLYGEKENLLVDLGSIEGAVNFDAIRDSIRNESREKELSLILTHFHEDHWSGLHNQTKGHELPTLKTVYLPDIFQMRIVGGLDAISRDLLGDFFSAVILDRRTHFTLADLLREVIPNLNKSTVRLLARGDLFAVGGKNYEVLWPDLSGGVVPAKRTKHLREFLERIESKLAADGAEVRLQDTIDQLANTLLTEFGHNVNDADIFVWPEQRSYQELYEQIENLRQLLTMEIERDEDKLRQQVRHYAAQLKKDWNKVSIVFHECGDNGVLMTGDIPKSILKRLINGKLGAPRVQNQYGVIKAPHHGTSSHFCPTLPQCCYLCISNGEGNPRYQEIGEEYERDYAMRRGVELRCTQNRCEYYDQFHYCPYFSAYPVALFYDVAW